MFAPFPSVVSLNFSFSFCVHFVLPPSASERLKNTLDDLASPETEQMKLDHEDYLTMVQKHKRKNASVSGSQGLNPR